MKFKKITSACLEALSCLVIICALVILPPSATHASSGIHSDQHAAAVDADANHAHGAASSHCMHGKNDPASKTDHDEQASSQCCSGICVSVVLSETGGFFVEYTARQKYLPLHAETDSIEPTGFLRPPLHLI
jgi:hypothetical protein